MIKVKRKLQDSFSLYKHYTKQTIVSWFELNEDELKEWTDAFAENPYVNVDIPSDAEGVHHIELDDTIIWTQSPTASYKIKGVAQLFIYAIVPLAPGCGDYEEGWPEWLNKAAKPKNTIDHSKYRCINPRKTTNV